MNKIDKWIGDAISRMMWTTILWGAGMALLGGAVMYLIVKIAGE